jgi:hypothetical protein
MYTDEVVLAIRPRPFLADDGLCCKSRAVSIPLPRLNHYTLPHLRTVTAAVVLTVQAPPAITFLHALHSQIPTFVRCKDKSEESAAALVSIQYRIAHLDTVASAEAAGISTVLRDFNLSDTLSQ